MVVSNPTLLFCSCDDVDDVDDCCQNVISTLAGTGSTGSSGDGNAASLAQFASPYGVAVDSSNGNVYISDYDNNNVRLLTKSTGLLTTFAGTGTAGKQWRWRVIYQCSIELS